MRLQHEGPSQGRFLLVVGEWDPPLVAHASLFRELVQEAGSVGLKVLAVTLDPSPSGYLLGARLHPPLHDVVARQFFQAQCGVQTRAVVSLTQLEVEKCGADYLLSELCSAFTIVQMAHGARQSLGRGELGDSRAIIEACCKRRIQPRKLPSVRSRMPVVDARNFLRSGKVRSASDLLGSPFYWSRPRDGYVCVPWPAGRYTALGLQQPFLTADEAGAEISVDLTPFGELSRVCWPDDATPWLGFVAGPGDTPAINDSSR